LQSFEFVLVEILNIRIPVYCHLK